MNGGRLSDDEAFLQGLREFRAGGDSQAMARALTRIAVRFPEQADELEQLLAARGDCAPLLARMEAQHRAEAEED